MKYRKAVFVVVYSKTKKGIEYLILKRKLHWKGWEFPKGGLNGLKEKLFPIKAVRREVLEETGLIPIKILNFELRGKYEYKEKLKDRPGIIGQSYKLYAAEVKKAKARLSKNKDAEHSSYKWVSSWEAIRKLTWPNQRKCLKVVDSYLKHE